MKKVIITGTTHGIGKATAELFLERGHFVYGLDILEPSISHSRYKHHVCDVSVTSTLPTITKAEIVINNAATIDERTAINVNLEGYINVVEKYCYQPEIKSIINVGSISGHVGLDGPRYSASNGGRLAYTKNIAQYFGNNFKATVNSISPGAVLTNLEPYIYNDPKLVKAIAQENLLKKWIQPEEVAELIYYMTIVNKSITGQDILIDNGEVANYNFITPPAKSATYGPQ